MRPEDGIITQLFEGCFQRPPSPPHSCRPLRNTPSPDSLERASQSRNGFSAGGDSGTSWRPPPPRTLQRAKKKKDPDADVYVHCGGNAGGQNVTRTFIFPGRATFLFAGFLIGVQQAPDTSRMSARQQVKENQNMEQHGR